MQPVDTLRDASNLRSRWPLVFSLILFPLIISYAVLSINSEVGAGTIPGVVYGTIGFCLLVFLVIYKIRTSVYNLRIGSTQIWLQAHIYASVLSVILVFMHTGFKFGGFFTGLLMVLFILASANGIIGVLIYYTIPLSISKSGRRVVIRGEVRASLEKFIVEADKSASGASDVFKKIYQTKIRPRFETKRTKWEYLLMEERQLIITTTKQLDKLKEGIPPEEVYDFNILAKLLVEKEKMSFIWVKVRATRVWLNWHLPLSVALVTAAVVHVVTVIYY